MSYRKIYVVGDQFSYINWMQAKLTSAMEEADLVLFTGGADVTPAYYGEPKHPRTGNDTFRDHKEKEAFLKARALNKHMLGICRGSQFLCVMSGGKLVQHQEMQGYEHPIILKGGKVINITSTHHQAQYPYNLPKEEYEILGWTDNLSGFHLDGNNEELNPSKECEIVYYPATHCLGIQGHPEFQDFKDRDDTIEYLRGLLNDFLNDKL